MSCRRRGWVCVGVMSGLLLGSAPRVIAIPRYYWQGERYKNETGSTARCLVKYLYRWRIDAASSDVSGALGPCTVRSAGSGAYVVLQCGGIEVFDGSTVDIRFRGSAIDGEAGVICAELYATYADGTCTGFIGDAIPVPSLRAAEVTRAAVEVEVNVMIRHDSHDWDGQELDPPGPQLGTIDGCDIYVAKVPRKFQEDKLNENLWTCQDVFGNVGPNPTTECENNSQCTFHEPYIYCGPSPGITWEQPGGPTTFSINHGQEAGPFYLGWLKPTDRIIFRYYKDTAGIYGQSDYEVVQCMVRDLGIPTMGEWGMVTMGMLLVAAGTIVFVRRRRMTVSRA